MEEKQKVNINITVQAELTPTEICNIRDKFHNQFTGNPDYVDSNIVVFDESESDTGYTEIGAVVGLYDCTDAKLAMEQLEAATLDVFSYFKN